MINIKTQLFYTVLLCIFFTSHSLYSQDRFVATTGDDTGPNDCTLPGSPCLTIQHAIDQASLNDVIQVSAGTYREDITINQSIILQGANQGTSGFATRVAETIIQPGATNLVNGVVINVNASNVEINGFTISGNNDLLTGPSSTIFDALQGIYLDATMTAHSGLSIQNNIITDFPRDNTAAAGNSIDGTGIILSAGILLEGSSNGTDGHTIKNNLFSNIDDEPNDDYSDQLGYGLILQDSAYADVSRNEFQNVGGGIFVLDAPQISATDSLVIDTCSFNNNKVGILLVNGATNLTADHMTIENSRAFGVRIVKFGSAENIDFYLTNSTITETGNALTNYSGLASETFSGTGVVTVRIDSCTIADNMNRGLTFRGNVADNTNFGSINYSTIEGNAYDGIAGNAFGVLVNRGAQVSIFESILSNSSSNRTATDYIAVLGTDNGNGSVAGEVTVRSSSLTATTGTVVSALNTDPVMDVSGNWWGTTNETTILSNTDGTVVDFSPWYQSGVDQDTEKAGFQPDLTSMTVGQLGFPIGSTDRIQEVITEFPDAINVTLQAGIYNESPIITRSLTLLSSGILFLDEFTMNGASSTLNIASNITINNTVTLTDGIVNVNDGSTLILTDPANDIVENANSRIEGTVTLQPQNINNAVGLEFLGVNFVNGNNDLSNLSITRISGDLGQSTDGNGNETIGVLWQLTSDDVPDNWTVNFSWPSQFDNGNPISDLILWRNGGGGFQEVTSGISASGDPRVSQDVILNSFSDYTLADASVLLPITLEDFKVRNSPSGNAILEWVTLTEENSDFFLIEKSLDGYDFFDIGSVKAAGNSSQREVYHFEDSEGANEERFYRLKMIDFDGTFEYSDIVVLVSTSPEMLIFPNPAVDFLTIPLASKIDLSIAIYDQQGRKVIQKSPQEERMDISMLRNGLYFYHLKIGEDIILGKLIVE